MYKKQRTISALLVCLLLASCGSGAVGSKDITDTTAGDTTEPEVTEDPLYSSLPTSDFGGETVKFLGESQSDWAIVELSSDEINGELINDKMYEADRLIEQRLNVKIESEYLSNSWDVPDIVRQAVVSGEDSSS